MNANFSISYNHVKVIAVYLLFHLLGSCSDDPIVSPAPAQNDPVMTDPIIEDLVEGVDYFLPNIDLSNWKVTLPIGDPTEVEPPEILDYAKNELLQKYMYNDSTDGSLVFYTYPGATTTNTSYSRTELREQMVPGSNSTNWSFVKGGKMKGRLAVTDISKKSNGDFHRTIIMQIHGRLSNAQRDMIGEDDNNAPPMLKIYWQEGKVRVKTKVLKDPNQTGTDILYTDAWIDDNGHTFETIVGHEPFTLEVEASEGKLVVTLNDTEKVTYDNEDILKWSVFENYFKAGNYLTTIDEGAYATVKYYDLHISH